jgi:hypothetical protein
MANFKKSYFTKESFERVELDIDKPYTLVHFVRPLISLFRVDGISVSYPKMLKMITGGLRQTWLSEDKNTNHYLFLEHDNVDGNSYYIVNKNFDWLWYSYKCEINLLNTGSTMERNITNELELLRSIAKMINKEFREPNKLFKRTLPNNISAAMTIWNEKFNHCEG